MSLKFPGLGLTESVKTAICQHCGSETPSVSPASGEKWYKKPFVKTTAIAIAVLSGFYGMYCGYRAFRPAFRGLYPCVYLADKLEFSIGNNSSLYIPIRCELPPRFSIAREFCDRDHISRYVIYGLFDSTASAVSAVKSMLWKYALENWTIVLPDKELGHFTVKFHNDDWCIRGGCKKVGTSFIGFISADEGIPSLLTQEDKTLCFTSCGFDNQLQKPLDIFGIEIGSELNEYELLPDFAGSSLEFTRVIRPPKILDGFATYMVSYTPITKKICRITALSRSSREGTRKDLRLSLEMDEMPPHDCRYYIGLFKKKFGIASEEFNVIGFNSGRQMICFGSNYGLRQMKIDIVDIDLSAQYLKECAEFERLKCEERRIKESVQAQKDIQAL